MNHQLLKTRCPRGHEYTAENTRITPQGHRRCRACHRDAARAAYAPRERRADAERFWEKVDKDRPRDCWEWTGAIGGSGYGAFKLDGRNVPAHRWAYEAEVGEIPEGQQPDHLCMNKICVNPSHIELVSPRENTRRAHEFYRSVGAPLHGGPRAGDMKDFRALARKSKVVTQTKEPK